MTCVRARSPFLLRSIVAAVVLVGSQPDRVHNADRTATAAVPATVAAGPAAGARVRIDPVTGTRVPELPAAAPDAAAALSRSFDGLVLIQRADGTKYVDLQGRFSSGTWVTLTPEGVSRTCRTTPEGHEALSKTEVR